MRTTLTIADDLSEAIDRRRQATGQSMRVVVDGLLRAGLAQAETAQDQQPYVGPVFSLGKAAGIDEGHLNRLVDELDAEEYGERKEYEDLEEASG